MILGGLTDATLDKIKVGIVRYKHVNRIGLVNILGSEVIGVSTKQLNKIVAHIAEQTGPPGKKCKKTWQLKPGYEVSTSS